MYQRLAEASSDESVKEMVSKQTMRLDSLDERETIQRLLNEYSSRFGHCTSSWREINASLRAARLRIDAATGAPLDPSDEPYRLTKNECEVDLGENSRVPRR